VPPGRAPFSAAEAVFPGEVCCPCRSVTSAVAAARPLGGIPPKPPGRRSRSARAQGHARAGVRCRSQLNAVSLDGAGLMVGWPGLPGTGRATARGLSRAKTPGPGGEARVSALAGAWTGRSAGSTVIEGCHLPGAGGGGHGTVRRTVRGRPRCCRDLKIIGLLPGTTCSDLGIEKDLGATS